MKPIKYRILTATSIGVLCSSFALPVLADNDNQAIDSQEQQMSHKTPTSENNTDTNDKYDSSKPKLRNAWIEGKLETALLVNRHLDNFTIDNSVNNGKATLTGTVESDIDRDLAEQVAMSIEGINEVDNQLKVDKEKSKSKDSADDNSQSFGQKLADMTTTAVVKSKLLANENTNGLDISVKTVNDTVSLTGNVSTSEEKQLAEKLAANTDDVRDVKNMLKVQ